MKGSHSPIKPSMLDSLWALPRTKADWIAAIEEIIERGPTCTQFVADELCISFEKAGKYMRTMAKDGIIERRGRMMICKEWHKMYGIPSNSPKQESLISEPVARDWLVAAFFGEYNPTLVK